MPSGRRTLFNVAYRGLLAIGDPHVASRVPGFRKDDYPAAVLRKLRWCFDFARREQLLPCILGDLFHWPRDNANWLLGAMLELLEQAVGDTRSEADERGVCVLAIAGNHDCAENSLGEDDSLSVLAKSGRLRLVDRQGPQRGPWRGTLGGRPVVIGGTSWGQPLPDAYRDGPTDATRPLVFWLTHHDVRLPGYDAGRFEPLAIPGIDVVINGHIHRPLEEVVAGGTRWINPGNITRIKRSDSNREHVPCVLRIDVDATSWSPSRVEVPHEPFEAVFHEEIVAPADAAHESVFVQGLAELVARRTASGEGLRTFLQQNVARFEDRVGSEIMNLAEEILSDVH